MISGWFDKIEITDELAGTAACTIGCPEDFFAVRLGFANISDRDFHLPVVIGSSSSRFGDYVNPIDGDGWRPLTFAFDGRDSDLIVSDPNAPTTISVRASEREPSSGHLDEPSWTWTDWAPIASAGRDPETGLCALMLRTLLTPNQTVTYAVGQLRTLLTDRELTRGFDFFVGGVKFGHDRVTFPDSSHGDSTRLWIDNQPLVGNVFPLVQFRTARAGVVGMAVGDSHHQGTSTCEQFSNYLYRSMVQLSEFIEHRLPVGSVNCAQGGLSSDRFFSRFERLLPVVRPSFAILPGWTFNDEDGGVHAGASSIRRFTARLLTAIEMCRTYDVEPICLTPFPRDAAAMGEAQMGPWQELRHLIKSRLGHDVYVVDAAAILGAKASGQSLNGLYQADTSSDGMHPNDTGHQLLADRIVTALRARLMGIGSAF